ncbi:formate dehydrogenase accessory sulfurtransferase FdhD [Virgibacillus halodenitrificans]|uniref:formate dehydrogenase accessory sulfurtransferase FdhD n=1 Tax=Virgibacillus halodenitrificans TaxID=1482 RepID=UPI001EED922A|nr:formate dehydrogenase accessory sulfurtransferase FdhD [Virgibacillus halodenitrificans]MCG1029116.1 formate dehydrogenase accessory sulfurtransferase FdhD [Virgibacillus halodenitrificans]
MNDTNQNDWEVIRFDGDLTSLEETEVAEEFPLTVMINGEEFATMVCSPSNLESLVIGFLAAEGVIRSFDEISSQSIDREQGFAYIELTRPFSTNQQDYSKRFIGSCCGKSRQFYFQSDVKTAKTIRNNLSISANQCYKLMRELQERSEHFKRTGGVHNAALCTVEELLFMCSDIGRHNALDKVYGSILQERIPLKDKLIVFSGRISSEVLLKISKIGVGIIISKSAPTNLALELATDLGITIAGFVRGNRMTVFTNAHRISEANNKNN